MIKVAFLCSWGDSSEELLNKYRKQTPKNSGVWGKIRGIKDPKMADVIIFLGNDGDISSFYNKKIIQLRREPDFIKPFNQLSSIYFDYNNGYHVSTWQYVSKSFDDLLRISTFNKNKCISAVTSSKWEHRNQFFREIDKMGFVDIYGENYKHLHRIFKDKALENYTYSIAIENSSQKNYFTEKINDCFLFNTMPIYWGCPNLSDYFPEDSYIKIDLEKPEEIKNILERPLEKRNFKALEEAKNLVMYKYNIWPTIEMLI
jgi:hypothetical protein